VRREISRIIDANLNRSREGLRVCEDIARFAMNSGKISRELKTVRHAISSVMRSAQVSGSFIGSRRSGRDVGRFPDPEVEMARKDLADTFAANIQRVKESLRVLEELFKLSDPRLSARVTSLRFAVYGIEKRSAGKVSSLGSKGL
jgi:thiamine-phosphate pyrophosphorylase